MIVSFSKYINLCSVFFSFFCIESGIIPKDTFTYKLVPIPASVGAFVTVLSFNVCGATLSFAFLVFNIYYRNNRYTWLHYIIV